MEFDRPAPRDYETAARQALDAFDKGADVLYQPTFHEPPTADRPGFIGFADFIVRNEAGEYEVYDTKLARHAKISALLQLAAYAERMQAHGIPTGRQVHLVLGDRTTTTHDLGDIAPVYRTQRAELERVIAERIAEDDELRWGDPRYSSCGRCAICQTQVQQHRDLVLVAGMRLDQRSKLIRQGVRTIDDLADRTAAVPGLSRSTQDRLVRQARLQTESEAEQRAHRGTGHATKPRFEVLDPRALDAIPAPDPATCSSTSRATPCTPRTACTGGSTTCSAWSTTEPRSRRSGRTRSATSGRRWSTSSRSCRSAASSTPACTSTTTPRTSGRTCSPSPPGTASARTSSTTCSARGSSSTCTRSSARPWWSGATATRSRSSSRSTWATTCG